MKVGRAPAVVAFTLALLSTGAALAQSAPADEARAAFDSAQKLFDEGKLEEARALFDKAYRASGSPNARLMAARCLSALDRVAEAYEEMAATSREATADAEKDPRYVPTRDAAATELALLERRVAKVTVVITDFTIGTVVTLNGAPLAVERLGFAVAVAPGKVTVQVRPPADAVIVREATLAATESQTITITRARRPAPVVTLLLPPPAPWLDRVRAAGFVTAGFGAIGMAVFAGAGATSNAKFADLQRACGATRCTDPSYAGTVDTGKALDTTANVALAAGLAGLVGGGLMILLGGSRRAPVTSTTRGLSVAF